MPDHFSLHTGKYIRGFNSLRHTAIRQIKFRVTGIQPFSKYYKTKSPAKTARLFLWEHTGSNRGPSACKADALNQLS